jgi:hypothetical protein
MNTKEILDFLITKKLRNLSLKYSLLLLVFNKPNKHGSPIIRYIHLLIFNEVFQILEKKGFK